MGTVIRGTGRYPPSPHVDGAIVRLRPGSEYYNQVTSIGPIKGTDSPDAFGLVPHYFVQKRGYATHLTEGEIISVSKSSPDDGNPLQWKLDNQLLIQTTEPYAFGDHGDSGSVVVKKGAGLVVGLLNSKIRKDGSQCLASPIAAVMAELQITIETATAADVKQTIPVPATQMVRADDERAAAAIRALRTEELSRMARVERELRTTAAGRTLVELYIRHTQEVRRLIDGNRRVATAWHRAGGPEILATLRAAVETPRQPIPTTLAGESLVRRLERILHALHRHGSSRLRADIAAYGDVVRRLGGCTYADFIDVTSRPVAV